MKKSFFLVIAISLVSSVCFAQQTAAPVKHEIQAQVQPNTFTGKIDSVMPADSVKGTKAQLTVADVNGSKMTFVVSGTAVIHDTEMAVTTLDKLAKEQKAQVRYRKAADGTNEAVSITLLK